MSSGILDSAIEHIGPEMDPGEVGSAFYPLAPKVLAPATQGFVFHVAGEVVQHAARDAEALQEEVEDLQSTVESQAEEIRQQAEKIRKLETMLWVNEGRRLEDQRRATIREENTQTQLSYLMRGMRDLSARGMLRQDVAVCPPLSRKLIG